MTILLLKGYNNYFNRIKKSESSISAYKTASTSYLEYANVNFDPQDGIMTSLVVGGDTQKKTETVNNVETTKILDFESGGSPDYLIVHDNTSISSRWFVVECVRVRAGQYKLALKRDVLVDFNAQIMSSPCFIEKGFINDINNPLLLNAEGMSFNQIKYGEELLKDKTHCAWLVGYLKKNIATQTVTYTPPSEDLPALDALEFADCIRFENKDGTVTDATKKYYRLDKSQSTMKFRVYYKGNGYNNTYTDQNIRLTFSYDNNLINNNYTAGHSDWEGLNSVAMDVESHGLGFFDRDSITSTEAQAIGNALFDHTINWGYITPYYNTLWAAAKSSKFSSASWVESTIDPMQYNGQQFKKNNKVYTLIVGNGADISNDQGTQYYTGEDNVAVSYLSQLYYSPKDKWFVTYNQDNPSRQKVKIQFKGNIYSITAREEYTDQTYTYIMPASADRAECTDALYDIFAMPIMPKVASSKQPESVKFYKSGTNPITIDLSAASDIHMALATILSTALGAGQDGSKNYDLQILPYCPIPKLNSYASSTTYNDSNRIKSVTIGISALSNKEYTIIYDNQSTPKASGIVFYTDKANFTTNIDLSGLDQALLENISIDTSGQTITDPVFEWSGSDEDGYYWYWTNFAYPPFDRYAVSANDLVINIEDYDPTDYAYGGWMTAGSGLYFGIPVSSITGTAPATLSFTGTVTLKSPFARPLTPTTKKVQNECDTFRLTSPNYNGMFEFKKTKLDGGITEISADVTLKPFTPYIKLNPNLKGSYYEINDYDDSTGLICGGDFSIPMMVDAFTNYALNNKNYQNIFDRQIQSMDVNQRIAREQLDFQGLVGTIAGGFTGSAAGLSAGMKTGNPYVAAGMAIAGGVAGNVLPAVGWAKDKEWLYEQQHDARDFATDQFQYQLGNVKALPQSITKSSPLSYNNKIWPILEFYTCRPEEKEVLENKLKYNGMTIMAIGKLQDYMTSGGYLKGKMIRIENLGDDSHIANAIYEEVEKGFYQGE